MTTVVNHHTYRGNQATVDIGRGSGLLPHGWGNPYTHVARWAGPDMTLMPSRSHAIEAYRERLWAHIQAGEISLERLAALDGHVLACWCKPSDCHGDVLAKAAAWAATQLHGSPRAD